MALQKEVTIKSVETIEGRGYTVGFNLTCWPDSTIKEYPTEIDGIVDMKNAIIYQNFSGLIKSQVEGKTESDLINRLTADVQPEMQKVINNYIEKDKIETGTTLETVRSTIEGGLTG